MIREKEIVKQERESGKRNALAPEAKPSLLLINSKANVQNVFEL